MPNPQNAPPWPDKQDEKAREAFLQQLQQLLKQPDVDIWFAYNLGFEGDPRPRKRWDKERKRNERSTMVVIRV